MFAAGTAPRSIARTLNDAGTPGPGSKPRGDTTIRGHVRRGNGIVNNSSLSAAGACHTELASVEKQIAGIVEAIADSMDHPLKKQKTTGLEARKAELTALLADAQLDTPDLLPSAVAIYA